ncbi:MAG: EAL domain-containing protein [Kangiellaceae bacterium]|nr:EAL domain-containing protein [Kangiellaceae bacterium]MCW9016186.1 EAL domain-containing protein [Kangiellaceae bacterium]
MKNLASEKFNILIVEDNPTMSAITQEMLKAAEVSRSITAVTTGLDAINQFRKVDYDCILLDYDLPDMDARQVLVEFQSKKPLSCPVLILTAHEDLEKASETLSLGAVDFITKSECSAQILKRAILFAVTRRNYEQKSPQNYANQSTNPSELLAKKLTGADKGVVDFAYFLCESERALARARRYHLGVSVMVVNINRDSLGSARVNDPEMLFAFSQRLKSSVRALDLVGWMQDDLFCVLIEHITDENSSIIAAKRIKMMLELPIQTEQNEYCFKTNIGICHEKELAISGKRLVLNAQAALENITPDTRDGILLYRKGLNSKGCHQSLVQRDFRKAIKENQLFLEYQPIIDIESNKTIGAETLARWYHTELGLIPPMDFIPFLEDSGFVFEFDDWLLNTVFDQISSWQDTFKQVPTIAINLMAHTLLNDESLERIERYLDCRDLPGSCIQLELSESLANLSSGVFINSLNKLKSLGASITLDNFGAELPSASVIKSFPFDTVKIDRSLVNCVSQDSNIKAITEELINIATQSNKQVIVEGIETEEQLNYFKKLDVKTVQGFYFSRPIVAEAFKVRLFEEISDSNKIVEFASFSN